MALHVAKVSEDFIRVLASEYLVDNVTMKSLAKQYSSSPGTISNILFRGVSEYILDDVTSAAITKKVVANTDNIRKTYKRWEYAFKLRDIKLIEIDIPFLTRVIDEISFQIETYDDYFFDDECAPSKKSLRCNRAKAKQQLEQLQERLTKLKGELT